MNDTSTNIDYNSHSNTLTITRDFQSGSISLDGIIGVKNVTPEDTLQGTKLWHLEGPNGYLRKSARDHFFIGKGDPRSEFIEVRISKSSANKIINIGKDNLNQ